jgi:hypothetical protein
MVCLFITIDGVTENCAGKEKHRGPNSVFIEQPLIVPSHFRSDVPILNMYTFQRNKVYFSYFCSFILPYSEINSVCYSIVPAAVINVHKRSCIRLSFISLAGTVALDGDSVSNP